MEALEIEGQTDQTPLASRCVDTAQGELAKAQHLLDDADHRFNRAFACAVDGFAQRRPELVGHLEPPNSRPRLGDRAVGRNAAANWHDGDHGPWRCTARCTASHTRPSSRGQNTRHPVPPPAACQWPMEWHRAWVRLPESHWGDWRGPIQR